MGRQVNDGVPFTREIVYAARDTTLPLRPWYKRIFSNRRQEFVGLDIGSHTVKIVHVCRTRNPSQPWAVTRFATLALDQGIIENGEIVEFDRVLEAVKKLVDMTGTHGLECAIGLPPWPTIVKKVTVPKMDKDQLKESLHWEAEQYIPFDIREVNVDADIVEPNSLPEGSMNICLVAAKKGIVVNCLNLATAAGLRPITAEPCEITLANLVKIAEGLNPQTDGKSVAIIDIGAESTKMSILFNGSLVFSRDINTGGNAVNTNLMSHFDISWEEAEKWKINGAPEEKRAEVAEETARSYNIVAIEIQKSLDFFLATDIHHSEFKSILVTGGVSNDPAFLLALALRLKETITPFNLFTERLGEQNTHLLSTALGLALRGLDERKDLIRVNLSGFPLKKANSSKRSKDPDKEKFDERKWKKRQVVAKAFLLIFGVMLMGLWLIIGFFVNSKSIYNYLAGYEPTQCRCVCPIDSSSIGNKVEIPGLAHKY
ncbi:MAG: Type IV pilus assembly protein PilM [Candidatus Magasanikbacteria bacterium GW2011_GWC2_40_17]|uniref:Type IV pilus assembly protein PilM n=1 Tax=Candidatus Magasanikbacteria bacterium GW2011_GWA2_42_32 TaxID=1619039 RepID=A0A0G1A9D7_9BACT|nr:MAG: Type IV pilus assembly protein PilM [Candidatus Magasanikbacteria bacterium GW2011_GWC2_40_17]KKS57637.1 MAG: Type IV pilus assembly protein PilM [Candidatus Magasanikbacteria bacterium GW2011_GWA2_42_32]OGH85903.1 MAG: hypothetical protein A2294_00225 [Candidatus Magasanikbacteria bacterium RIFOXYB2_FULL_38_10]